MCPNPITNWKKTARQTVLAGFSGNHDRHEASREAEIKELRAKIGDSNGTERCGTESSGRFPYAPQCRRYSPVAMSNTITRRLVLPKATRSGASFRTDPARRSFCVVWVRHQRVP